MTDLSHLPGALEHHWSWQLRAACRDADSGLFFHPSGERGPAHDERDAQAKTVCARCPVRAACLEYALDARERYGVWGGLTAEERRRAVVSRRRRGRRGARRQFAA
ncbi:WhiB family transcriptional regulator [Kitasatospora kifunensis]|uniref:Transcriptional regulator WhiB n=1 Tax=Kitasatospora kifunensis TaxID=58351 RepID=A0A7W7R8E5_KITKI|nr:WhiB family transcriptional regulator [Kitasatospora kifunensis]MBB4927199.1 WhiB family redox-sensing transcriptional regulator [Kitasatospora kifunensis]